VIACPHCRTIQSVDLVNTGRLEPCPGCSTLLRTDVFKAFLRRVDQGAKAEDVEAREEAQCFYHPGKKALVPCSVCGRLLCAVCRIELDGQSLCVSCLQAGRDKQKISALQHQRTLYDSIALNLAFWPMLMIFPTLLTAPAALYFAVRHFRVPAAILPRTYLKNILALLLAAGQIAGWIVFAVIKFKG
jgi:hypothetical protein